MLTTFTKQAEVFLIAYPYYETLFEPGKRNYVKVTVICHFIPQIPFRLCQ